MRTVDYFETHPVFAHDEFVAVHTAGGRSEFTSNNLLAKHLASGRLIRVKRGLYAVVQLSPLRFRCLTRMNWRQGN